ncbi:hypothetical protein C8035_v002504 [Colletotrichum spinosum]|uniref:Ecp2 effector protein domain-containing protein n=1 Tax=Colletotrichum spinosum TaxID=1347390 RepID=A0A4R8PWZ9_9PEZI|nr:hypothetical protein C8035_v002504 [Colletotrichum spinosum]
MTLFRTFLTLVTACSLIPAYCVSASPVALLTESPAIEARQAGGCTSLDSLNCLEPSAKWELITFRIPPAGTATGNEELDRDGFQLDWCVNSYGGIMIGASVDRKTYDFKDSNGRAENVGFDISIGYRKSRMILDNYLLTRQDYMAVGKINAARLKRWREKYGANEDGTMDLEFRWRRKTLANPT